MNPFPKQKNNQTLPMILVALIVVLAGVGTGWILSGTSLGSGDQKEPEVANVVKTDKEAGVTDDKTFPDSEQGVLEEGGIDGEGTHHLVRPGGVSQNIYLTSTVIDLSSFVGKKVQVWGETNEGKKAGWLMDVGKVKVID